MDGSSHDDEEEEHGELAVPAVATMSSSLPIPKDDATKKMDTEKKKNTNPVTKFMGVGFRRRLVPWNDGAKKEATAAAGSSTKRAEAGAKKEEEPKAAVVGSSTNKKAIYMEEASPQVEEHHQAINLRWLKRVLKSPGINLLHKNKKSHGPRFLAIVTPPVDIQGADDEDPHGHRRATEIARRQPLRLHRLGQRRVPLSDHSHAPGHTRSGAEESKGGPHPNKQEYASTAVLPLRRGDKAET